MAHVVVFAGEYDVANKQGLRRELRRLASSDDLVLDLTQVTYIDSTFIAELILLERERHAKNFGRVTIVSPTESCVRRVFDICGMTATLALVESYAAGRDNAPNLIVEFAATGDCLDTAAETKPREYLS